MALTTNNPAPEPQSPRQSPPEEQRQEEDAQHSIMMSLTLDDIQIQCSSEMRSYSISMDEFLNSIGLSTTNVDNAAPNNNNSNNNNNGSVISQASNDPLVGNGGLNMIEGHHSSGVAAFSGQNSYFIPTPMSNNNNNTFDEIWDEIQMTGNNFDDQARARQGNADQEMMTLEDFLIKAGVVRETPRNVGPKVEEVAAAHDVQHHAPVGPYFNGGSNFIAQLETMIANNAAGFGLNPDNSEVVVEQKPAEFPINGPFQMVDQPQSGGVEYLVGVCSNSNIGDDVSAETAETSRRKRESPDASKESAIDRRQRRMIKNRQSAAKSRARKQAYNVELEFELNHLKEENARIKQILFQEEENKLGNMAKRFRDMRRTKSWFW